MGNIDMRKYCFTESQIEVMKVNVRNLLHKQHMKCKNDLFYTIGSVDKETIICITGKKRFYALLLVEDLLREYGLYFCKRNNSKTSNGTTPFTDFDWEDSDGVSSITILF